MWMQLKCCASRTRSLVVAQVAGAPAALHVVHVGRPGDQREIDRVAAEMDRSLRIARRQRVGRRRGLQRLGDQPAVEPARSASRDRPWRRPSRTATARAGSSPRCRNSPGYAARPRGSPRPGRPTAAPSADRDCAPAAAAVAGLPPAPRLLVRSAPRLASGSLMPALQAPANGSDYRKTAICGRDFSQGVISAISQLR